MFKMLTIIVPTLNEEKGIIKTLKDINKIKIAKEVLDIMVETGEIASKIVESKGLKQVSDISSIEKIIDEVIKNNQENFVKCQNGDQKLFGFFVGQVMKESKGQANPSVVNELLKKKLS